MSLFLFAAVLLSQSTSTFRFSDDDLAAYRKALSGDGHEVSKPVEFLDLWQHGDVHRGRVVSLSGRVVRQFHVPALEGFPPRNELWLSKGENLICAVVREESPSNPIGRDVSVVGVSLGTVKYQSGDGPRLAPLMSDIPRWSMPRTKRPSRPFTRRS